MDAFDFEELVAEILNVTDEQRDDYDYLPDKLYNIFDIEFEAAYKFTRALLMHTSPIKAGISGKSYHAFVSRKMPVMLMKLEVQGEE